MSDETVIPFPRYGLSGYYALGDLPQRASIERCAISSGWGELDPIFKMYHGQLVVLTGKPGHGKSTFLMNVQINLARQQGIRSFLYVPENERNVYSKLQKIWGEGEGFDRFVTQQCFVQSALTEHYDGEPQTLPWVLDRAAAALDRDSIELVIIDPWNEIERAKPKDMLLTDYIGDCLRLLKQFCRHFDVVMFMVAHPTKAAVDVPALADIEGSMNWWNKCDNGLIVHRDQGMMGTQVISAKVREEPEAGTLGMRRFWVDPVTGRFVPMVGPAGDYDPKPRKSYGDHRRDRPFTA